MAGNASSDVGIQARAYQYEMFEESMKRNIIIAMDTGSGKTQVAIMRIAAELERCETDKRVWMTCPTVVLVEQQCQVVSKQLPAYQCRTLSSNDDIDHWSNSSVWKAALENIHVVVSTPQVLDDALRLGFVKLEKLALIVFDEAHHCKKKDATNRIMQHYHRKAADGFALPHILGLTASPAKSSRSMKVVEQNLAAVCRAPMVHTEDLRQYVHKPILQKICYKESLFQPAPIMDALAKTVEDLEYGREIDLTSMRLGKDRDPQSRRMMAEHRAPALVHLRKLLKAAQDVYTQLGQWAVDHYLRLTIERVTKTSLRPTTLLSATSNKLTAFMGRLLYPLMSLPRIRYDPSNLSSKVDILINLLAGEHDTDTNGIIFVQRRVTAVVLASLLSHDSRIAKRFKASPFVGSASHVSKQKDLQDIADTKLQHEALHGFRKGTKDLLVATSVLEEGLDVPATNLVIRFDPPPDLRSYIQSRGRARKAASKFIMMLPMEDPTGAIAKWDDIEEQMKALYTEDVRQIQKRLQAEEEEEYSDREFVVESTGARLTLDDAPRHLYHFCASLPKDPYADNRPEFVYTLAASGKFAKVILPAAVDASLRVTESQESWITDRMAKKDCAFEAYIKLYHAGLVNEHLLPIEDDGDDIGAIEQRASFADVQQRYDVWAETAVLWNHSTAFAIDIKVRLESGVLPTLRMLLPSPLESTLSFPLFWDADTTLTATVKPGLYPQPCMDSDSLHHLASSTRLMLMSLFSLHMPHDNNASPELRYPYLLSIKDRELASDLGLTTQHSSVDYDEVHLLDKDLLFGGLLRRKDRPYHVRPYAYHSSALEGLKITGSNLSLASWADSDKVEENFVVRSLPKRLDYLHNLAIRDAHTAVEILPASIFRYDPFPLPYAQAMLFFPAICHRIELRLVAQILNDSILRKIRITDVSLVETAITAPSARESSSYDRFEFLGDTLLKVHTSFQVYAEHPHWHEGRLSVAKTSIINNAHLYKAALNLGLDRFIHTDPFQGAKWKPPGNTMSLPKDRLNRRQMSTKTIADVVEAIIGAAYLDGVDEDARAAKVLLSLQVLLPDVRWRPIAELASNMVPPLSMEGEQPFRNLVVLQDLLSYPFCHPRLLISALTHPSILMDSTEVSSYQQLEFLGDALLDKIIVESIFHHRRGKELRQDMMTLVRHALANAHILGLFCLNSTYDIITHNPVVEPLSREIHIESRSVKHALWEFMRHNGSRELIAAQTSTQARHELLGPVILDQLARGTSYPWIELLTLRPEKFNSDIIEAILAAIFIDSGGNIEPCRQWLRKLGLLPYLERVLDEGLDCVHPKMKVGIMAGGRKVKYRFEEELDAVQDLSEDISLPSLLDDSERSDIDSPSSESASLLPIPLERDTLTEPKSSHFTCKILVDNEIYGSVSDAGSRAEAEARVAVEAIHRLELERALSTTTTTTTTNIPSDTGTTAKDSFLTKMESQVQFQSLDEMDVEM